MTRTILMAGSLPLAAPWNGADKNVARLLVMADEHHRFIVQTSLAEPWPAHVQAVREPGEAMPTTRQKLRALAFASRYARHADLVHVVASLSHPFRWSGALLRGSIKLWRVPIVHTLPSIGDQPIDRRHFPGDVHVVVSAHTERRLLEHGFQRVERVMPPLDLALLRPRQAPEVLRAELKLGPLAVLYPAHYGPHSGIAEMIAAFAALPPSCAEATLVLACRTTTGQDPAYEAEQVLAQAQSAGIADRLRIVTTVKDMPALIQACALTALVPARLASKMDLPLVLLEALALGRPVIVADQPPMVEALLGDGGAAVPYGNVPALTAALERLLGEQTLRTKLAESGQQAVLAACSPASVVARYQQIFEETWTYPANHGVDRAPPGPSQPPRP